MSLSSAVQAAVSGLGASARRAETVATNVANASSPGYARRSLDIATNTNAAGVRILDMQRHIDRLVLSETRLAQAELGKRELLAENMQRLESAIGAAGDSDSVAGVIDRLQTALITAAGDPSSETRLREVAEATSALAQRFARASDGLQATRTEADRSIAADVEALNAGLIRVARLDRQIVMFAAAGRDTSSFQDLKQREIDAISRIVPLRETVKPDGRSVIATLSGAVLLDGQAVHLSFERSPVFSATGPVGGVIRIDGKPVSANEGGLLAGGTLSAAFDLRDRIVPDHQAGLDALAAELATRLSVADRTLSATDAGLLTDGGDPIDSGRIAGLSSRLSLNDAVDPDQGGELWRIRSGIAATTAGPSGSSTLLDALQASLAAFPDMPATRAAALTERVAHSRVTADIEATAARARAHTLEGQLAQAAVDTDAELQELMQIEKGYAANARVLQAVDEMLAYLLAR